MLFLLNDAVFDLSLTGPDTFEDQRPMRLLDFEAAVEMGCDLYAEHPRLEIDDPARARRLAWLISHLGAGINAARFHAPEEGCNPLLVEPRFGHVPPALMLELQAQAALSPCGAVASHWTGQPFGYPTAV